jgi:FtsP/CotA-like multicopper oxidase with cupredoxin domain
MSVTRTIAAPAYCVLALLACSSEPAVSDSTTNPPVGGPQQAGWSDAVRAPLAQDESPDPGVFETHLDAYLANLEILPGTRTDVWTYSGGVPGPEIRVERGTRVVVHFTNHLPEPTTIHWHGLRIPNAMDGAPGRSQPEIQPGQTFTYDFVVPDAGTFWYHPHVASSAQVGFGLYGSLVVVDPEEPAGLGDELTLVLSDMSINPDGSLQPPDSSGDLGTLFGREGFVILVNGKQNPIVETRSGRRQRWRLINAARSRYFQLGLAGHRFTRIAGDGGLLQGPVDSATVVIIPGERAEVVVTPSAAPGSELPVRWIPYFHGYGTTFGRPEETMFRLRITDDEPYADAPLPALSRTIQPIDTSRAPIVAMSLTQNDAADGTFALGINGVPAWNAEPLMAAIGETQIWEVTNTIDFAHPFHLHGYFFQVLAVNGIPPAVPEWKDTADVPVDGTLRLAVNFDERPGMWMFHCHILDHADAGMMGMVHVH